MNGRVPEVNTEQHVCASTYPVPFADDEIERSLCARFAAQVAVHHSCLAVRDSERSLTYGELDTWANAIARAVLDKSGARLEPVALMFAQGATSIAAILGALKSGRAYVSLDPADPRAARVVESLNAALILTDSEHRQAAFAVAGDRPVVVVDAIGWADDPGIEQTADALAYVYFTSGSTGRPKGVCDSHRNVLHNVLRYTNTLGIAPTDRASLIQSPSFSGTVSTLFGALLNGAAVFPFRLDRRGVGGLARWIRDEHVTIYHSVPAIFRALLGSGGGRFPDVRLVRLEGDRAASLDVELHRLHFESDSILVNGLGLTETGLVRQFVVARETAVEQGVLPVGYRVRDMDVLIVDDHAVEVPHGVHGEIAVRSRYLALGYWDDPELTSERFLQSGEARTYLTGDLGRIRDDGCLEYLGRRDGGLKILGNRVEPAEVEAELVRLPGVKEAAVTSQEGRRGEGRLVAFLVGADGHAPSASDVRTALEQRLPSYMVPSTVSVIDELPLGASGKVDRRALPDVPIHTGAHLATSDLERLVARVWEDVLDVRPIGRDDGFFELGGDSLAAAEIVGCLERETGTSLPVSIFAGSPTVAGVADALGTGPSSVRSSLVTLRPTGDRAPLVLVHGNTGNLLHYAALVPLLNRDRPVLGLEQTSIDSLSVERIATSHIESLLKADPSGPFLVVGFCYGGVVAHEIACQLRADGHHVALLALLGITPLEFPTLLPPSVRDRWSRTTGPPTALLPRTRYHVRSAWAMPARERPRYLARRGINVLAKMGRRIGERGSPSASAPEAFQRALAAHHPTAYPGQALVVLHERETNLYTDDPARDWAALAEYVDLELLPGADHAMLEEPGACRLADLIHDRLASVP